MKNMAEPSEHETALAFAKAIDEGRMTEDMAGRYIYLGHIKREDIFIDFTTGQRLD